jgi:hypothetical protein
MREQGRWIAIWQTRIKAFNGKPNRINDLGTWEVRKAKIIISLHKNPSRADLKGCLHVFKNSCDQKFLLWADDPGLGMLRELNRGV